MHGPSHGHALLRAGKLALVAVLICVSCKTPQSSKLRLPKAKSTERAFAAMKGPVGNTGVVLIVDNAAAWATRWELLRDARQSIDLSTFIFDDDVFGFAVLGILAERARAGVKVRLLIDGRGSFALASPLLGRDYLQELVETGNADIHVFNPPLDELMGALLSVNATQISAGSHNKILVVDGRIAIVGGRNVNSHYFASLTEDADAVSDADVLLDGAAVVDTVEDVMDREFSSWRAVDVTRDLVNVNAKLDELLMFAGAMDAWVRGGVPAGSAEALVEHLRAAARARLDHEPSDVTLRKIEPRLQKLVQFHSVFATLPTHVAPREEVSARVVTTVSQARALKSNAASDALLRAIAGAQHSIVIQSPSFILNPELVQAFVNASKRQVAVTLLTNSPLSSDSDISQSLFIDSWPELCARIPTLRIFTARSRQMQHAKRAVFDDELTLVGTYNLDPFSTKMNSETLVATWSAAFAARNRQELTLLQQAMDEYRIARSADGAALRHPADHAHAGEVVVVFGPEHQVDAPTLAGLRRTKAALIGLSGLWDFEAVVW